VLRTDEKNPELLGRGVPPAATPALLQVVRFVVIPGLDWLLVVAGDIRDSAQVVNLRLLVGQCLRVACTANTASLPVLLVAC
jgi:hypothetical protein